MDANHITPGRTSVRSTLRIAAPAVGLIGLGFLIVGGVDFFSTSGPEETPRLFWCLLVGIPLLLVGAIVTQFAFADKVARDADEGPAAVGEKADGTKEGPGTVADVIEEEAHRGDSNAGAPAPVRCQNCSAVNAAEAKFCSQCGQALVKSRVCPNCGELNEPEAKFCASCCHVFK
jgi:ribosomal protein L32